MKGFIVFLAVVVYVASSPFKRDEVARTYLPEEENPYRTRFIITEDGDGKYKLVDLFEEEVAPKASASDVTLYFYTKSNTGSPVAIAADSANNLGSVSQFSSSRQNVFITHGWNNNHLSDVNTIIKNALLQNYDVNVFVVDWSGPANSLYTTAFNAVPEIGQVLANFINGMMVNYGLGPSNFNLIGHSLGAHVAGCTGAAVNGLVNYIIGLDPAGPLFSLSNTNNRIDPSDGSFVQIIHTNGWLLGFGSSIGHSDYFPNGGSSQPGCGLDIAGTCAHGRSYAYLGESILNSGFRALNCGSHSDYNNGNCNGNQQSVMGEYNIDKSASGDFYLNTNSAEPYAQG